MAQPNPTPAAGTPPVDTSAPGGSSAPGWQAKDLAELIEVVEPSVVRVDVQTGFSKGNGSGFVVDRDGLVITNHHVIEGARSATVVFPDGSTARVTGLLKLDASRDIALLKIDYPADKLRPIKLAAQLPRKGDQVVGFGAPLGLSFSASQGIVSGIRTEKEIKDLGMPVSGTWIQTTTPISPGNSGGPLVNMRGEVVAANTMTLVRGQNLNFAISSLDIQAAVNDKSKSLIELNVASSTPSTGTAPATIDATSSERGARLLANLGDVSLLIASFNFDPTGRAKDVVTFHAEESVKKAGLKVAAKPGAKTPQMVVTMGFSNTAVRGGNRLILEAVLSCKDQESDGRPVTVHVWKLGETIGASVSETDLRRGVFPAEAEAEVAKFFERFVTDHAAAVRQAGKPGTG